MYILPLYADNSSFSTLRTMVGLSPTFIDTGFTVACFNRTVAKVDHFMDNEAKGPSGVSPLISGKSIVGAHSIEELCSLLKRPRKVMLLVQAGPAVDDFIEKLLPHLEKGTHLPITPQILLIDS
jgi:6-phosphogluconate dehydrogenase